MFDGQINDKAWNDTSSRLAATRLFAVSAIIILAPLASGLRGFSLEVGRAAIMTIDLLTIVLFALCFLSRDGKRLTLCIAAALLLSVFHAASWTSPDPLIVYQGVRKSLFFLMAISIGHSLNHRHADLVIGLVLASCLGIALYGIKQMLWYSEFDRLLLDAQAASYYSNRIWGITRATSLLSSGFHLGMAGCIAIALSLASRRLSNTWRFLAVAIAALAIYASYTRTFLLLAAILIVLHVLLRRPSRQFSVAIVALGAIPFATLLGFDVLSPLVTALTSDDRVTNRIDSYLQFFSYVLQFPMSWIWGFGPGTAGSTLQPAFRQIDVPWIEPHGILLKYPFEFGAPLALAFAWLFWRSVGARDNTASFRSDASLYLAIIVVLAGLTVTSVETWPVNLYAGIVIGALARPAATAAFHD